MGAAVDVAAAAAAALYMRAAVAALVPVSAALVPVSAALVPVSAALVPVLSVALADARFRYTADARFLDAASAAVAVAAAVGAADAGRAVRASKPSGHGAVARGAGHSAWPNAHYVINTVGKFNAQRRHRIDPIKDCASQQLHQR